ncbi:hypothetical protein J7438_01960 [Thalassotalea sp. G20_0]|uniref:hypothetical protein n=1 Tax=Thalassotalea sp. G20_0 TaxID=2821093 RepID=UPI001ADC8FCF|nr:hypothetical protein [Thalassotalea sp. G20_0]MBO9492859.1 hypothetical protein [Thalassotalea sp. G20_0]
MNTNFAADCRVTQGSYFPDDAGSGSSGVALNVRHMNRGIGHVKLPRAMLSMLKEITLSPDQQNDFTARLKKHEQECSQCTKNALKRLSSE